MPEAKVLLKELAAQLKALDELKKQRLELVKQGQALAAKMKPLENPVFALTGFVAAYMNFVKKTNGLLSVMPSCLKAIQSAEKSATVATVSAAVKAIAEQQQKAVKEAGSDPEKKKAAAQFSKDLDVMSKKLQALL